MKFSLNIFNFLIKFHFIGRGTFSSFNRAFGRNDQVFSNTLETQLHLQLTL